MKKYKKTNLGIGMLSWSRALRHSSSKLWCIEKSYSCDHFLGKSWFGLDSQSRSYSWNSMAWSFVLPSVKR
jgi:hypothetical protein